MNDTEEIYNIENGKLYRKGEHIGHVEDDQIMLHPEAKNYQASVTRWVRSKADDAAIGPIETPKTEAQMQASRMDLLHREVEKGKLAAKTIWQDDCDFAKRNGFPQPPKKNPQFGDKSPAFVDWLHQYRPDEFARRFGVTRRGKVPIVVTNRDTGLDEVTGYRETYFARAKTHLTEVDSIDSSLGEDMDWNA